MKKAILVFTKVPQAGDCKTRLTEEKGGILTPEEAAFLYEACLLDVLDVCLSVGVDVWVCYNRDGDRAYLNCLLAQVTGPERLAGVFPDQGGSFDDCMQYAADFLLKAGHPSRLADALLICGGDLPTLQPATLEEAFAKLEMLAYSEAGQRAAVKEARDREGRFIGAAALAGPCQEGGFSLVGLTCTTGLDFYSVFYNVHGITALDMLANKVQAQAIPIALTEQVPDLDLPVDLASLIPVLRVMELAALHDPRVKVPRRFLMYLRDIGLESVTVPPAASYWEVLN
ncbi:MAG TPA: DUF2064 domain-containing protein [Clostridia bacterium]|nr:DUF2064 domain-containing protein [Clostridia bacterium]